MGRMFRLNAKHSLQNGSRNRDASFRAVFAEECEVVDVRHFPASTEEMVYGMVLS